MGHRYWKVCLEVTYLRIIVLIPMQPFIPKSWVYLYWTLQSMKWRIYWALRSCCIHTLVMNSVCRVRHVTPTIHPYPPPGSVGMVPVILVIFHRKVSYKSYNPHPPQIRIGTNITLLPNVFVLYHNYILIVPH